MRFCELLYTTTAVKAIKLTTGQEQVIISDGKSVLYDLLHFKFS